MSVKAIARPTMAALALAAFIHLDWHIARPAYHHLSLGLPYHWVLAVPVFELLAWYAYATLSSGSANS